MSTEVRDAIDRLNSNLCNLKYPLDGISSSLSVMSSNSSDMRYKFDNLAASISGIYGVTGGILCAFDRLCQSIESKGSIKNSEKKLVAVHRWQHGKPMTFEYVGTFIQYGQESDGSEVYPVMIVLKPDGFLDTVIVRLCKFIDAEEAKLLKEGDTW